MKAGHEANKFSGVTEVKNWLDLTNDDQLRAFHQYAREKNLPFNIIIGPRTQTISEPLLNNIRDTGGRVLQYDPETKNLHPLMLADQALGKGIKKNDFFSLCATWR